MASPKYEELSFRRSCRVELRRNQVYHREKDPEPYEDPEVSPYMCIRIAILGFDVSISRDSPFTSDTATNGADKRVTTQSRI